MNPTNLDRAIKTLKQLPGEKQEKALNYIASLADEKVPWPEKDAASWNQFAGTISDETAEQMIQAIDKHCERIEWDEWKDLSGH